MSISINIDLIRSYIENYEVDDIVYNGESLTSLVIDGEELFSNIFNYTLLEDGTYSIALADKSYSGPVTIPATYKNIPVTNIADLAFADCTALASINIPGSVTSIGNNAFRGCESLTSVYISDITKWCEIEFDNWRSNPLSYGGNIYLNNELVTEIVLPNSITNIGYCAFCGCGSLTSIEIPDSVTSIGAMAFEDCRSLTSIVIPDSVTSISNSAFESCTSLTSINIPSYLRDISASVFKDCTSLTNITIPGAVENIDSQAFSGCTRLTSVNMTNANYLTSIDTNAFENCASLTNITIPDSVDYIGSSAFDNCTSLKNINIPNRLTVIEAEVFAGCSSLINITIPSSVTSIGYAAFRDCTSLTSITIPANVTTIGAFAFIYCTSLTSATFTCGFWTINGVLHNIASGAAGAASLQQNNLCIHEWTKYNLAPPVIYEIIRPNSTSSLLRIEIKNNNSIDLKISGKVIYTISGSFTQMCTLDSYVSIPANSSRVYTAAYYNQDGSEGTTFESATIEDVYFIGDLSTLIDTVYLDRNGLILTNGMSAPDLTSAYYSGNTNANGDREIVVQAYSFNLFFVTWYVILYDSNGVAYITQSFQKQGGLETDRIYVSSSFDGGNYEMYFTDANGNHSEHITGTIS